MQENRSFLKYLLIISSFIEGGCLMAFEVLSIKIYTPYLGSSIYVWTSILTTTLAALAIGYWVGGVLSEKRSFNFLASSYIISGILVFFSTQIASFCLPLLLNLDIKWASLFGGGIILFFPVFFMGTISPLIVKILNIYYDHIGRSTGIIYGTGTIGGIFLIITTVYFFIPVLGVKLTSFCLGILLLLIGIILRIYLASVNEKK
ncbi:MAG: hypothetical protein K0S44_1700 [Bacteroidetes bacterium]|jgi:predicted membrane-bound spermidine synthase|nr:hypothetical protein [Bacteroidota bacterium]